MTTIELFTDDQKLYFTRKVYIASGDIESVQLHIDFCGAWDDFPVRTVTFTNDTTKISKDALMKYNRCIVPFEVLTKPGMLQVSVIANSTDGSKQKTSGMIKYRIDLGAELSDITLTPTMNVYQQFLSAIHDMEDPITKEMESVVTKSVAEMQANFEALMSSVNEKLSNTVKPCDFSNKIHSMSLTNTNRIVTWTATEDCWLSIDYEGHDDNICVKINGAVAIIEDSGTFNLNADHNVVSPVYAKKGSLIEFSTENGVNNTTYITLNVYGCTK